MTLKIEEGKSYRTRDGQKVGPMKRVGTKPHPWSPNEGGWLYSNSGERYNRDEETRIIAEWTDAPDLSNPLGQVFGLMPPETQEAMKAHGGPVEYYSSIHRRWMPSSGCWPPDHGVAYRVKPAPIRETVKRSLHGEKFMGYVAIDLVDGEPDWTTVRKWSDDK